jgi:hypothetical protein
MSPGTIGVESSMPCRIVIDFEEGHIHRMRNFGEALYHAFKQDDWASISVEEIDRAKTQLWVTVLAKRKVRRVSSLNARLLEQHHLDEISTQSTVIDANG